LIANTNFLSRLAKFHILSKIHELASSREKDFQSGFSLESDFTVSARMKFFVSFPQMRVGNMRVNLRRRNIGVSEHLLNRANIGAVLNQMRRKTMS
jgi:hypothetical protein